MQENVDLIPENEAFEMLSGKLNNEQIPNHTGSVSEVSCYLITPIVASC